MPLNMSRNHGTELRRNRRTFGLCPTCGGEPLEGRKHCLQCTNNSRLRSIKSLYGLSKEDYLLLLSEQDNKCAICSIEFSIESKVTMPHIDHDHISDEVRGLLCAHCNVAIGMFGESVMTLTNAIEYLKGRK
jgi:hypothetical protein